MTTVKSAPKSHAFWFFFPSAAWLAAIWIPLTWLQYTRGQMPAFSPAGHAHEMLFGFVLALIAGYTLGQQPRQRLIMLWSVWLLARLLWLALPFSVWVYALNSVFFIGLSILAVPRFRAAKQWRNQMLVPLLLILCLILPLLFTAHLLGIFPVADRRQLQLATLTGLLLLMAYIGGRIIFPALSATLQRQKVRLAGGLQPGIEGALIITGLLALLLILTPLSPVFSAILLLLMAGLILLRLLRWQPWRIIRRSDLVVFFIGYAWLALGGAALAGALLNWQPDPAALHLLTIGALGILSISVMLRTAWQRTKKCPPPGWQVWAVALLLSAAALARWLGVTQEWQPGMLVATLLWTIAYSGCALQLLLLLQQAQQQKE